MRRLSIFLLAALAWLAVPLSAIAASGGAPISYLYCFSGATPTSPASWAPCSVSNPLQTTGDGGGGGAVYGPTANGSPAANPPIIIGGVTPEGPTGTVYNWLVNSNGWGFVDVSTSSNLYGALTGPPNLSINGAIQAWTGLTPGTAQTGTIYAANTDQTSLGGVAYGAMANFGTTPGAVKVPGSNASLFMGTVAASTGAGVATGGGVQRVAAAQDGTTIAGSAPVKGGVGVVNGASGYQAVAASQTAATLQSSTGAAGDYLSHCKIYPTSTSPGAVTVFDSTNTAANSVVLFPGGASSVSNLVPWAEAVGAVSINGAWKVTTGASVSVVCFGKFS